MVKLSHNIKDIKIDTVDDDLNQFAVDCLKKYCKTNQLEISLTSTKQSIINIISEYHKSKQIKSLKSIAVDDSNKENNVNNSNIIRSAKKTTSTTTTNNKTTKSKQSKVKEIENSKEDKEDEEIEQPQQSKPKSCLKDTFRVTVKSTNNREKTIKKSVTFNQTVKIKLFTIIEGERTRFIPCLNLKEKDIIEKYERELYLKEKENQKRPTSVPNSPPSPGFKPKQWQISHLEDWQGGSQETFDTNTMSKEDLIDMLEMNDLDSSGSKTQLKKRLEQFILSINAQVEEDEEDEDDDEEEEEEDEDMEDEENDRESQGDSSSSEESDDEQQSTNKSIVHSVKKLKQQQQQSTPKPLKLNKSTPKPTTTKKNPAIKNKKVTSPVSDDEQENNWRIWRDTNTKKSSDPSNLFDAFTSTLYVDKKKKRKVK